MGPMIIKRLLLAIPLALGAATLVFVLMESAPGSPVDQWIGNRPVPPEVRDRLERAYGLDRPAPERYVRWLSSVCLKGELGWSHSRSRPVRQAIAEALPATLLLSGAALLVHLVAGIGLGLWSALSRGRIVRGVHGTALALYAMPVFWVGLMAILLLAVRFPVFPPSSMRSVDAADLSALGRWLDILRHLALPALVLGLSSAAGLSRFVRGGLLTALAEPFVHAARARGLHRRAATLRHALRPALLPVVNLIGMTLPILVSGTLIIEVVFGWPGMGRLTYNAIQAHDLPVVLATTVLAAGLVIIGNLLADIAMAMLDPRVRDGLAENGS
ncbi:MAG: ABC transporter permease [Acidobacteria bacterium]|uniref:ABC transporter permease n=1 Tax=Candidatus Polarisedimenticola svalbardensis TaxID=2886004 RepID=A0A8J7C1H0_9BACT|nr:ABC transporter permease [Candidatus Polarisedimenticola svalbardensis]